MLVWVCLSRSLSRSLPSSARPPVPVPRRSSTPLDFGTLDFAPVAVDLAAFVPLTLSFLIILYLIYSLCSIRLCASVGFCYMSVILPLIPPVYALSLSLLLHCLLAFTLSNPFAVILRTI